MSDTPTLRLASLVEAAILAVAQANPATLHGISADMHAELAAARLVDGDVGQIVLVQGRAFAELVLPAVLPLVDYETSNNLWESLTSCESVWDNLGDTSFRFFRTTECQAWWSANPAEAGVLAEALVEAA